jgi:hypothetical protein
MRIQGDILYAGDGPFYILFDTRTGWVLDKGSAIDGKFPPSDVFPVRELQAINSLYVDAVVGNTLYWGGEGVKARDISNGSELWFSNTYLISPITVTRDSVYAISKNGDLMRFDSATGAAYVKIHFTPAPMAHFFQEDEHDYNNFVSVDPATNVAYVYLGDSQTFTAYQLNP